MDPNREQKGESPLLLNVPFENNVIGVHGGFQIWPKACSCSALRLPLQSTPRWSGKMDCSV